MPVDVSVTVAKPNGRGYKRLVTLTAGDAKYQDAIDPASGFERERLLDRAAEHLVIPRHRLSAVDSGIVQAAEQAEAGPERIEFPGYTLAGLKAMDLSVRYFIENIMAQQQPMVVAGAKKTLKTSLLLDLGISLATAGKFLGYFPVVEAAKVGLMTGESGLSVVLETGERIARAAGRGVDQVGGLVISDRLPLLADPAHLDGLRDWLADYELTVLMVDPLYMALDDTDPANLFAVGRVLHGVNEVCQERGVTLVVAHHTKKGVIDPFAPGELEDLAWAGTAEWCRQWMMISRREKYIPGTGEHRLWLSVGGSAGHSGYWGLEICEGTRATPGGRFWDVHVLHPDDAREAAKSGQQAAREQQREAHRQAQVEADKKRLVEVLVKLPAGETPRALRERAGLSAGRFNAALAALLDAGDLEEVNLTKSCRKAPYEAYKLAGVNTPER